MSEAVRVNHTKVFYVALIVALGMMIGGFVCPPTGVIDNSVLYAAGICFAFAALSQLPIIINGHNVAIKHGDTSVTIEDDD